MADNEYRKLRIRAEIDCAECAAEVEEALASAEGVKSASFSFPKKEITVLTTLTEEEIKAIARKAEEDIIFPDEEYRTYRIKAEIDCAECAHEVEEALRAAEGVRDVSFSFPKKEIRIETVLSEAEVKRIAMEAEDEIVFPESIREKDEKDYRLLRIFISALFFAAAMLTGYRAIAVISYLIAGYDVLLKAARNIAKGKVFDENFLMAIATVGALIISSYDEAAGVMIFYQVGEYFQDRATEKSRRNIAELMDLSADTAEVERNGEFIEENPENVLPGEIIRIKAGAKVPMDSEVISGESFLDTKALTGESVPVKASAGDSVLSGSINGEGTLICRVLKPYSESTAAKIMKLIDESEGKKASGEKFISKFSKYYTPAICIAAAAIAVLTPVITDTSLKDSLYRACMLLVISCPCALVLSVPLTYFAAMGSFAKRGILVKSDETIQKISKLKVLALDKTGTLTEGVFSVQKIMYAEDEDRLIHLAASLERNSTHPIAKAILEYAGSNWEEAENVREIPGIGLEGTVGGKTVRAGSERILRDSIKIPEEAGTLVYITEDDKPAGVIIISDRLKETSAEAVKTLREQGVREVWMLSGDRKQIADKTASAAGLDGAYGELLPQDKIQVFESLMQRNMVTGFAGDGINDAPVLKRADIGFAMGGVGSDAAIEAADAVIMNDDLMKISTAMRIAKKTENVVKENIVLSLGVKALVFILAAFGIANMWLAVIADTGVALAAVMNSLRALRWNER